MEIIHQQSINLDRVADLCEIEAVPQEIAETRICVVCGAEKPIEEFRKTRRWRFRVCHPCQNARRLAGYYSQAKRNLLLYGVKSSSRKLEYGRQLRRRLESDNLSCYGRLQTPERYKAKRLYARETRDRLREAVVSLYGGECVCCGEDDTHVLSIDHINGGGRKESCNGFSASPKFYTKLLSLGYPNGQYRLLCMNCNAALGIFGVCPHTDVSVYLVGAAKHTAKLHRLKLEMIDAYGGRCQLCGEAHPAFLTIDHVDGRGSADTLRGSRLYYWLRRHGWPQDKYRLLCFNCNCSDGWDRVRQRAMDKE